MGSVSDCWSKNKQLTEMSPLKLSALESKWSNFNGEVSDCWSKNTQLTEMSPLELSALESQWGNFNGGRVRLMVKEQATN